MTTEQNPATPGAATEAPKGGTEQQPAAPGKEQGVQKPSAGTPAPEGDKGGQEEGKVTISTKEFANLQRDQARLRSFQRRAAFNKKHAPPASTTDYGDDADPDLVEELRKTQEELTEFKKKAHQQEVLNEVRNILDKDEYKTLPKSTRELILKNPAMLSNAETVEEAMIDIEEFIAEQAAELSASQPSIDQRPEEGKGGESPEGHETPTTVATGTPAPTDSAGLEDTSNLKGSARSRATLRNLIRKQRGVK